MIWTPLTTNLRIRSQMIAQSEIKREETEPDQMPSFEMDSEYSQDRVKQEIQIEIPATDSESPADSEPLAKRSRDEFKQTKSKSVKKKQKINELEKQLAAMKEQVGKTLIFLLQLLVLFNFNCHFSVFLERKR